MNSRSRRLWTTVLLVQLVAATAASAATARDTVEESLPLSPGGRLSLENVNGNVDLETWDRDEVRIVAMKEVRASSSARAEELLEELRLDITRGEGSLDIEVDRPRDSGGGLFGWIFGSSADFKVHFKITAPATAELDIETVNGHLQIAGSQARVVARSINGRLDLERLAGPVEARTTNGAIRADLSAFTTDGDLRLSTTNGSITVTLPADARADVDARTTNGSIRSDLPVTTLGSQGRKHLRGKINGGGGRLDLRTTNGSIRIETR